MQCLDAGISCREIENRMKRLGLSLQKVKGVFVSHEHTDHIKGIPVLAKKYQIPIYIIAATLLNSRCIIDKHLVVPFVANGPVVLGNLATIAFPKMHDASDPHSFVVVCKPRFIGLMGLLGF